MKQCLEFLISNLRRVRNVVCFLLGNSPESEFCINDKLYKIQTPGNYPEESIQHDRPSFTPIQSTIISLYITHTDRCFSQNQTLVCRVCTHCDQLLCALQTLSSCNSDPRLVRLLCSAATYFRSRANINSPTRPRQYSNSSEPQATASHHSNN